MGAFFSVQPNERGRSGHDQAEQLFVCLCGWVVTRQWIGVFSKRLVQHLPTRIAQATFGLGP